MVSNTKQYSLAYYHKNQKLPYICECGHTVKVYNKYRHIRTNKHKKYLTEVVKPITEECKECKTA